jgi:hypothetical protein
MKECNMVKTDNDILQLSLFETTGKPHTNYMALYDLAPRFALKTDRLSGTMLSSIKREFYFNGDLYRVVVTPARITDAAGNERDVLPGEREQLVEDVLRKLAIERISLADQDQVRAFFYIYRIHKELSAHKHTFSKAEIREALEVLNKSTIEIVRVSTDKKKPQPVLYAAAFPVLAFADQNDLESQAYVQLNPLLATAIKTLAYEQVNYNWLMRIKGQLPRWLFKSLSLLFSDKSSPNDLIEIKASDVANGSGCKAKRWREVLLEVSKAVQKLKDKQVIEWFEVQNVMDGRTKVDVVFSIKLSKQFMDDRRSAIARTDFNRTQAEKHTGSRNPEKFHPISSEAAVQVKLEGRIGEGRQLELH